MNTTLQITPNWGRVLAVLIAVLLVGGLATAIVATDHGNWQPAYELVYYGAMALVPFLLARLAPTAAGFDAQWLPSSRGHWVWFLGMFALLFALNLLVAALALVIIGLSPPEPPRALSTPIGIIFEAITAVLVVPVAEEIFFRGYLLEQFRKVLHSNIALLAQSFLFALAHLYARGFYPLSLFNSFDALLFALVVGLWRIKLRSLLPIVLVHILGNATVIPLYMEAYEYSVSRTAEASTPAMAPADESDVTSPGEFFHQAQALFDANDYPSALRELKLAVEVDSRYFPAHYLLAWIYATSPGQDCRDKEKALFHATTALTLWNDDVPDDKRALWMPWACLAAAYAEIGDFAKAIQNQKKAIECLSTVPDEARPIVEPRVKACLLLYTARKPLRSRRLSLGQLSDAWLDRMSNPGPKGFPEIAE